MTRLKTFSVPFAEAFAGKSAAMLVLSMFLFAGCASVFSSATARFADNLSHAFENSQDTVVVKEGAPAYLLMMDALIRENPGDVSLLTAAAKLNAVYADMFVEDPGRSEILTEKAMRMALKAACVQSDKLCGIREKPYGEFEQVVQSAGKDEIDVLFTLGGVWASWIQVRQRNWNAFAELPRVEAIMLRAISLNPEYGNGEPYLYLGVLATLLPPAMGGKTEQGREYFEKAIELSGGKNHYAKYLYAWRYARLVFDRQLHDRLLNEIVDADPNVEGYALSNAVAREKAKELLKTSDDYF